MSGTHHALDRFGAGVFHRTGARGLLHRVGLPSASTEPLPSDSAEVAHLLRAPAFRSQVRDLAERLGRSEEDVLAEAASALREMSAMHDEAVIAQWQRFGRWMRRGYDTLLDEEALAGLRELDRKHSLIFLISHRSYLDEWVLPPALVSSGISPPYGLAGANLNFFPLGTVARHTGMVHIRRSTSDAPVYRLALRAYIGQLVANRANLIWSIEGGRSRTGKLRPPRYGLLRYVVDAVQAVDAPEALVVPVSIVYDQLPTHEVSLMVSEARGLGKQPENLRWLLGYAQGLRHRLGRVYVDLGQPLRLRERLAELRVDDPAETHAVERVALEVSHRINRATPVTPTAAVCVALLAADRALTMAEVLATVAPLADYLQRRGWPVAGAANLTDRSTVRRALQELVASGVLTCYSGGTETVWGIGADQHLVAAVYRNSAIHVLVVRAIAELGLVAVARHRDGSGHNAWDEALRLRELLKFDFFFARRREFAGELQAELALIDPDIGQVGAEVSPDDAERWLERLRPHVAHLVLRPFLDAYSVVAEQLATADASEEFDEQQFLAGCLRVGRQWALQRRLASEESVSAEMFRTALQLARHRGLLTSDDPSLSKRRKAFADELREVRRYVAEIADLASRKGTD
ncbi:MAG TPA: lysophospholipid acyltransferase [Streptosporangiaceae bacterium]